MKILKKLFGISTDKNILDNSKNNLNSNEIEIKSLITSFKTKTNEEKTLYLNSLSESNDENTVSVLINIMKDISESSNLRGQAAKVLCNIGNEKAILPLIEIVKNNQTSGYLKEATLNGLHKFGKAAVEPLLNILQRGDERIRGNAAIILGGIPDKNSIDGLKKALNKESNFLVKMMIQQALEKLGAI